MNVQVPPRPGAMTAELSRGLSIAYVGSAETLRLSAEKIDAPRERKEVHGAAMKCLRKRSRMSLQSKRSSAKRLPAAS
jgi:hypothetical protein